MVPLNEGDRYVAMGSSFAAGPGLRPRAPRSPRKAGRSSINYAHIVAARLGLSLVDVTFSGATTAEMLRPGTPKFPGQIDAVTSETKLVTITSGGNDAGYLPGLVSASLPRLAHVARSVRRRIAETQSRADLDERFGRLETDLGGLVDEIHRRAPDATVVLVDYLTVLPANTTIPTFPLPPAVAEWGRDVAGRLSAVTRRVADTHRCLYISASTTSASHDAWSGIPWTKHFQYTLRGGAAYHPTAAGMAAVADMVADALAHGSNTPRSTDGRA